MNDRSPTLPVGERGPIAPAAPAPEYRTNRVRPGTEYVTGGSRWGGAFGSYLASTPPWVDDLTREFGTDLYDKMQFDDQVSSSLRALAHSVLSEDMTLRPAVDDEDDEDFKPAKDVLAFCERCTWGQTGGLDGWLFAMLKGALGGGNRVSETVYRQENSGKDAGKWTLDRLNVKPRRAVAFVTDRCNNLTGILGAPAGQDFGHLTPWGGVWGASFPADDPPPNLYPREKFCVLSWDPPDMDPRGSAVLRCVYEPWWSKLQAAREWLAHLALFGSPGLVGTTAPGADSSASTDGFGNPVEGDVLTPEQDLVNQLLAYRNGTVIAVPAGATVAFLQTANAGDAFVKKVESADRAIAAGILLAVRATMEAQHGSKADSQTAQDVAGLQSRFMKRWLARMVTEDLLRPLVRLNYGPDAAKRLCPYASLSPTEHQDLGPALVAMTGAWTAGFLKPSQLPWAYDQFGMPPATPEEMAPPPVAPPGSTPGQPPGGGGGPQPQPQPPQTPPSPVAPFADDSGGRWVTTEEGQHVFLKGGQLLATHEAISHAAGLAGPLHAALSGKPRTLAQLVKTSGLVPAEVSRRLNDLLRAGHLEHSVLKGKAVYSLKGPGGVGPRNPQPAPAASPTPRPAPVASPTPRPAPAGPRGAAASPASAAASVAAAAGRDVMQGATALTRDVKAALGPGADRALISLLVNGVLFPQAHDQPSFLTDAEREGMLSLPMAEAERLGMVGSGFGGGSKGYEGRVYISSVGVLDRDAFKALLGRGAPFADQPRVPAGSPEGGQWGPGGGGAGGGDAGSRTPADRVDLPGMDPAVKQRVTATVAILREKYLPVDVASIKYGKGMDPLEPARAETYASGRYVGGEKVEEFSQHLLLNEDVWKSPEAVKKVAAEHAGELYDPSARGMLTHEYAHLLDSKYGDRKLSAELYHRHKKDLELLSTRAAADPREMFAELFVYYDRHGAAGLQNIGGVDFTDCLPLMARVSETGRHAPFADQPRVPAGSPEGGQWGSGGGGGGSGKADVGAIRRDARGEAKSGRRSLSFALKAVDWARVDESTRSLATAAYAHASRPENRDGWRGGETADLALKAAGALDDWGWLPGAKAAAEHFRAAAEHFRAAAGGQRVADASAEAARESLRKERRRAVAPQRKALRLAREAAVELLPGPHAVSEDLGSSFNPGEAAALLGPARQALDAFRTAWGSGQVAGTLAAAVALRKAGASLSASLGGIHGHEDDRDVARALALNAGDVVRHLGNYAALSGSAGFSLFAAPDLSGLEDDLLGLSREEILTLLADGAIRAWEDYGGGDALFGEDQPRVPAGSPAGGRFTSHGFAVGVHGDLEERPGTPDFSDPARVEVEDKLLSLLREAGVKDASLTFRPKYSLTVLHVGEKIRADVSPYGEDALLVRHPVVGGKHQAVIRPCMSPAVAEYRLRRVLRLPIPKALHDAQPDTTDAPFYSPDQLRDDRGRWTTGGGSTLAGAGPGLTPTDHRVNRQNAIDAVRSFAQARGIPTMAEVNALAAHLAKLTVAQLHEIKAAHGLKASAPDKAALVEKLAYRFREARGGVAPKEKTPDWPEGYDIFGKRDVFGDGPVDPKTLEPAAAKAAEAVAPVPVPEPLIPNPLGAETVRVGGLEVRHTAGTSAHFRWKVGRALESLPRAALDHFAAKGGYVATAPRLMDLAPELAGQTPRGWSPGLTWEYAEGLGDDGKGGVIVTELKKISPDKDGWSWRTEGVLRHELGHGLDKVLGYPSITDVGFSQALLRDRAALTPEARAGQSYLLQPFPAGESEVFAEVFGALHGGSADKWRDAANDFPHVAAWVKERVASL